MNYENLNDYEICSYIQENDENALELLFDKYKALIYNVINPYYRKYKFAGIDEEDLVQEAKLGLLHASKTYNGEISVFITYAHVCIERQIINYCRTFNNMRNYPLNSSVVVNYRIIKDSSAAYQSVEDILIENECFFEAKNSLNFKHSVVFELRYNHFTYKEISELLNLPMSTVDGRIRSVRKMLNNSLNVSI